MKIEEIWLILYFLKSCSIILTKAQLNRPPRFVVGGDMAHFSIPEDIEVGSTVYKLRGTDPEEGSVYFSISGEYFSVNKYNGDVILTKELDREVNDTIEVIISITDEQTSNAESNTVSLRREIPIIDVNDNSPTFGSAQYSFTVSEQTQLGFVIYNNITISDTDFGVNSMVNVFCIQSSACQFFSISLEIVSEGYYKGIITLSKPLNYEIQSSYTLWIKAIDSNPKKPLSSVAKVLIDVTDVQDQPPVFLNTPYSISAFENTKQGEKLLTVEAKDGDVKNVRPIVFTIEEDVLHYFTIQNRGNGNASIFTTDKPMDREHPVVIQMGGIYTFYVKATELINNELPGDETRELVTIVIHDRDDQLPKFNKPTFRVNVSEDISVGSPLPGLGMIVSDDDIGENAHFSLALRASDIRFTSSFSVEPVTVTGKSPVIIRVINNSDLDYEKGVREIKLYVIAYIINEKNNLMEVTNSEVIVNLVDANDNLPKFSKSNFVLNVTENTAPGTRIANIVASDRDSGIFSFITYSVGGFGMDKFDTDPQLGGLILINKLDYEQQSSYSLTLEAKDGGDRTTMTNILVNVIDVNDNRPIFEHFEYRRNIREGSQNFQPQFFIKASDVDGIGNNNISYSIVTSNSDAIDINEYTGEITMSKAATFQHTSRGQYELKIRANDSGTPSMFTDASVFIRVGVSGNQRPVFKGIPYNVTVPESLSINSYITTVSATDPDGPDDLLEYKIVSGADNFYINSRSGAIHLSENVDLDINESPTKKYHINVLAIDSGMPIRETSQTTVTVNIVDINNKPPVFQKNQNYVSHISAETFVGATVMKVKAEDPDETAKIKYSLLKPFQISNRRGFLLKDERDEYNKLFGIDEDNGDIKLQKSLNSQLFHEISIAVEARDINAVENAENQYDRVEVTFFIETMDELRPVFLIGGWMRSNPTIMFNMFEEEPIGSNVIKILAQDPVTMLPINKFQLKSSLPRQLAMDSIGNIVVTERIDYETIQPKKLSFLLQAISDDGQRRSDAKIVINVIDINDHAPQFLFKNYHGFFEENSKKGTPVLLVTATDGDLPSSPQGYGNISYYLTGEHAFFFDIDPNRGEIKIGNNIIDREKQPLLNLIAVAMDTPSGGKERKKSEVSIQVDVLDVNDNAPTFSEKEYSVVILENSAIGESMLNVTVSDPDIGPAGKVTYQIFNEFDSLGLFEINSTTGEMKIKKSLTGRGRSYPYSVTVRAQDNGEPVLFTDAHVNVLVGDVVTNDGIPVFIHPTSEEIAYISEDSPAGSPVFHVVGIDPDDPFTPEGQIRYSFLRDSSDVDAFNIDPITGIISTLTKLDRETKKQYYLMILMTDGGAVPQQTTRVLGVHVNDTDDNIPLFKRAVDEKPLQITIQEELSLSTVVGSIEAIDLDEEHNAEIGYLITDGNEDNLFSIFDNANNSGLIKIAGRVDREKISHVLLTIKCFKKREKPNMLLKKYNKMDFTERQVYIDILDIDDHVPEFTEKNITIGVRLNIPIDSYLLTLSAHDDDIDVGPITYTIISSKFIQQSLKTGVNLSGLPFTLNNYTGEMRTNSSMMKYSDGYFMLEVSATSAFSKNYSTNILKICIIREKGLLRFVFAKTPDEVKESLPVFRSELENALALPSMELNIYETQFHSKQDGSIDFTKTSSCFQVISDKYGFKDIEQMFKDEDNGQLQQIYERYNVKSVERCGYSNSKSKITWVQISLLSIASFIGITSIISTCVLCCSYSRWQRLK